MLAPKLTKVVIDLEGRLCVRVDPAARANEPCRVGVAAQNCVRFQTQGQGVDRSKGVSDNVRGCRKRCQQLGGFSCELTALDLDEVIEWLLVFDKIFQGESITDE